MKRNEIRTKLVDPKINESNTNPDIPTSWLMMQADAFNAITKPRLHVNMGHPPMVVRGRQVASRGQLLHVEAPMRS